MMDNGLSVADAMALTKNNENDGWFGGSGSWVFFLFFLLAWGNGGFGGFGGNGMQGALTRAELNEGLNNQAVISKLDGISNGLCDGFYAQNTTMLQGFNGVERVLCQGFNGVNNNVTNLGYQMQNCCCETNRNIDSIRYENAKNTCDIMQNNDRNTQRIIDTMTQNTVQELRDQLQAAQLQLGTLSQTSTIINAVRPTPIPAYVTCSPYEAASCCNGYYRGACGSCN